MHLPIQSIGRSNRSNAFEVVAAGSWVFFRRCFEGTHSKQEEERESRELLFNVSKPKTKNSVSVMPVVSIVVSTADKLGIYVLLLYVPWFYMCPSYPCINTEGFIILAHTRVWSVAVS